MQNYEFSLENFKEIVGEQAYQQYEMENPIPALVKLEDEADEPAQQLKNALYRFFLLGSPVTAQQFSLMTDDFSLALAKEMALVDFEAPLTSNTLVQPKISIVTYAFTQTTYLDSGEESTEHLIYVISDLRRIAGKQTLEQEYVMSIGGATKSLANMLITDPQYTRLLGAKTDSGTPAPTAVDIGCGSGAQALILAKCGYETYATDISEKALEYTQMNAHLNNVQITTLKGSLFEPVAQLGLDFDLIVSNPPFVITAQQLRENKQYTYRDAGLEADRLLYEFIATAVKYLKDKALALFIANWEERQDRHWSVPIMQSLPNNAELWAIRRQTQSTSQYVDLWMKDAENPQSNYKQYERNYRIWLKDFENRQVESISFGYFILQRHDELITQDLQAQPLSPVHEPVIQQWTMFEDGYSYLNQPHEKAILDTMRVKNYLQYAKRDPEYCLMQEVLLRREDVTEERSYTPGEQDPRTIVMSQSSSLGRSVALNYIQAGFLGACSTQLSGESIVNAMATLEAGQRLSISAQDYENSAQYYEALQNCSEFAELAENITKECMEFAQECLYKGFVSILQNVQD